jgi:hypothetical protein
LLLKGLKLERLAGHVASLVFLKLACYSFCAQMRVFLGKDYAMTTHDEELWREDEPIPLDHPLVPPPIALAVRQIFQPGDALHRVPTNKGLEWWLLDSNGELIEAFWLE